MAEIGKRGRPRASLGEPPASDEARGNLAAPEVAPAAAAAPAANSHSTVDDERIDGRTLRRTGRTEQFATRVHPNFRRDLQRIAQATGKHYNEILEESLALYGERLERERSGA